MACLVKFFAQALHIFAYVTQVRWGLLEINERGEFTNFGKNEKWGHVEQYECLNIE